MRAWSQADRSHLRAISLISLRSMASPKLLKSCDRHDECAGPADHVLSVILGEAAGRIGVQGQVAAHGRGAAVEDRQAVDDRACFDRRIARRSDGSPLVARSVSRDVDDPPVGRDRGRRELAEGEVDRRADRRSSDERPRWRAYDPSLPTRSTSFDGCGGFSCRRNGPSLTRFGRRGTSSAPPMV